MNAPDDPASSPAATKPSTPPLTPQLEQLRQRALAKTAAAIAAADAESDADEPRCMVLLPRFVVGGEALIALVCVALTELARARAGPADFDPTQQYTACFFVVAFMGGNAWVGLQTLMPSLRPMLVAERFTRRVPGVVEAFCSDSVPGEGMWLESPGVDYAYEVDGTLYRGALRADFSTNMEGAAESYLARMPQPGSAITVRVHPSHPDRSTVVGHEPSPGIHGGVGVFLLLLGLLAPLWYVSVVVDFLFTGG